MTRVLAADVRRAATWSIPLSVLMIVAGLLAIGVPMIAGVAATILVGWLLVLSGVLHVVFAWRGDHASAIVWEILLGVVYAGVGLYLLVMPGPGLASLTLAIAAYLLVEGILESVLSFQLRPAPGAGWLLFDGIITLVLAVMIWSTWPSSAAWVVGTLIGISMVFSGITRLMFSLTLRRLVA